MAEANGILRGIAWREEKFATMQELESADVTLEHGIAEDSRGKRRGDKDHGRQVTLLSAEAWREVCAELGASLPWTFRRSNLLIEGLDLRNSAGAEIRVGKVALQIACEIDPCKRMDQQHHGLMAALAPNWRGGVGCRILKPGRVRIGDQVMLSKDVNP